MTPYLQPKIQSMTYVPISISQYPTAFANFSGRDKALPSTANCAVELSQNGLAACLAGEVDATNYRVVILVDSSVEETLTIGDPEDVKCELQYPGDNGECQDGDTYISCESSLIFDSNKKYLLQIQKPAPASGNDSIVATSEECVVTSDL